MTVDIVNGNKDLCVINEVIDTFNPMFSKVTPELIKRTGLYGDEVKVLFDERWVSVFKNLQTDGLSGDSLAVGNARDSLFRQCLVVVSNSHVGELSPFEVDALLPIVQRFSDSSFDLGNPSVYLIVKSIVDMSLNNVRLQLESSGRDALSVSVSDGGVVSLVVNPALRGSLDFSKELIVAVEKLNRVVNGDRVEVSLVSDRIKSVWDKRKLVLDVEDVEGFEDE